VNVVKLLSFLREETKISKLMKSSEINAAVLGKLMVISAIVES
jgi:hypothetical protein